MIAGLSMTLSHKQSTKAIRRNSEDVSLDDETINHINNFLRIRRTSSITVDV